TYCSKLAAVSGALSANSSRVMTPWLVCSLIMAVALSNSGKAGGAAARLRETATPGRIAAVRGLTGCVSYGLCLDRPTVSAVAALQLKDIMSKPTVEKAANFLRPIVQADLESGKHAKIITRFPPEPNGYLHIGHAKSICLNFGLAEEFGGECNLRFDDTNPAKEDQEYIDAIKADVEWLGFRWAGEERYASNYFDQLHAWAIELIKAGKAFVCDLNAEEMREYRGSLTEPGKNSPFR